MVVELFCSVLVVLVFVLYLVLLCSSELSVL